MLLKADQIANELRTARSPLDPFVITPTPDLNELEKTGSASIDLRLGCWFLGCRQSRIGVLNVYDEIDDKVLNETNNETKLTKSYYVPYGEEFVLHPKSFVLAGDIGMD